MFLPVGSCKTRTWDISDRTQNRVWERRGCCFEGRVRRLPCIGIALHFYTLPSRTDCLEQKRLEGAQRPRGWGWRHVWLSRGAVHPLGQGNSKEGAHSYLPPDPQLWQSRRGNEKKKEQKDLNSPSWSSRKMHPTWGSELWVLQEIWHFGFWNETIFATSVDCRKSKHWSVYFVRLSRGFTGQLEFSTSARRGTLWNKKWQHFYDTIKRL